MIKSARLRRVALAAALCLSTARLFGDDKLDELFRRPIDEYYLLTQKEKEDYLAHLSREETRENSTLSAEVIEETRFLLGDEGVRVTLVRRFREQCGQGAADVGLALLLARSPKVESVREISDLVWSPPVSRAPTDAPPLNSAHATAFVMSGILARSAEVPPAVAIWARSLDEGADHELVKIMQDWVAVNESALQEHRYRALVPGRFSENEDSERTPNVIPVKRQGDQALSNGPLQSKNVAPTSAKWTALSVSAIVIVGMLTGLARRRR
jgi:hypothetical protein